MRACPFCRSDRVGVTEKRVKAARGERTHWYVRCNACHARGPIRDYEGLDIRAWDGEDADASREKSLFDEGE